MDIQTAGSSLSLDDLREYFLRGAKSRNDLKVGVEWEKIGVYKDTARAISYSGERGVEKIFNLLVENYGWNPVHSNGHIIALRKNEGSITLEPGGQIELSGQKALDLADNFLELDSHLTELRTVSDRLGIAWLGLGAQPVSAAGEIEWVPKERYAIMRESLKNRGLLTYSMMKETASIQVSIDFTDEKDAIHKFRLAMGLAPILSAMFANSPLEAGRPSGFLSRRSHIWLHTAPERSGIIEKAFNENFCFDDYIQYALEIPVLFIERGGKMIAIKDLNFLEFMKKGFIGYSASAADWGLHLSTIFTEARLKSYLEVRCIDCQRVAHAVSAPALIKGIFYDALSARKAWDLVAGISIEDRRRLASEVPKKGLSASFNGMTVQAVAEKLMVYAKEGLERINKEEVKYLAPLEKLIREGRTPAEILLGCFSKALSEKEKVERILDCAAIDRRQLLSL